MSDAGAGGRRAATRRARVADFLSLERNVMAASAAVLLPGTGEELWKKFLPKYLEALGAGPLAVGLSGTAKDFFDAVYQYPGGWLADVGDALPRERRAMGFTVQAMLKRVPMMLAPFGLNELTVRP